MIGGGGCARVRWCDSFKLVALESSIRLADTRSIQPVYMRWLRAVAVASPFFVYFNLFFFVFSLRLLTKTRAIALDGTELATHNTTPKRRKRGT